MTADDCPACAGRWPRADHRIAELGHTLAYLHEDQFFPGWTLLVLKRHATELFDLAREERAELIGNQIPHIHWHVVPRLPGDPAPRGPVWLVEYAPRPLSPDELSECIQRIRSGLR